MRHHRPLLLSLFLLILTARLSLAVPPYQDAALPTDERVADLLGRMSVDEKFWQLFMLAGSLDGDLDRYEHGAFGFQLQQACDGPNAAACVDSIQRHFVERTRLGIPVIIFEESLHGLVQEGATAFPQAIGLAATFDPDLMADISTAMAREARARGIRQVLSPVVNLADDVRWGRTEETYGEDPFLSAAMGVAFVRGFEERGIITTPKHLVANVGAGGRDSYPISLDERSLRETHLVPFRACFQEGGSRSVMTSYNSLGGIPCSAHPWLLRDWLKQEVGFEGFVISDAGAVGGANVLHMTAHDYAEAGTRALTGGLDVIFQTAFGHAALFRPGFDPSVLDPGVLNAAVARVLRAKFELGLFDDPYIGGSHQLSDEQREEHHELARRTAAASCVLLENRVGTLPLDPEMPGFLAVLGPDADAARLGGYSGPGRRVVSIVDGLRQALGSSRVAFAPGCARESRPIQVIPSEFLSCTFQDQDQTGLLGAYHDNSHHTGTPVLSRVDPGVDFRWTLSGPDADLLPAAPYAARWQGRLRAPVSGPVRLGVEGDDGYRLWLDGRLVLDRARPVTTGRRMVTIDMKEGQEYDLRLEFAVPVGPASLKLVWDQGLPVGEDELIEKAVETARKAQAAIVVVGLQEGEFQDRSRLALPGRQAELIRRVLATGTPTTVVIVGGSAVTMDGWAEDAGAILQVWYPGEAGGEGIADVLLGRQDPGGRLPITFPIHEGQLPLVYNHRPTGRGDDYRDGTGRPRYPFGHGLSYTRFAYTDLAYGLENPRDPTSLRVEFTVRNVGSRPGEETAQLYIRDEVASTVRPVLELKGFQKVRLQPGESRRVSIPLDPGDLAVLDENFEPVPEPGVFQLLVGASSRDIRLRKEMELTQVK